MTAIFPLHQNMAAMSFLSAATHCAPSSSFHGCLPVGRRELLFPSGANLLIPKSSNILDNASNLFTNLLSGGSLGSMLTAEGDVSDLFGKPLFLSLVHGDSLR